MQISTDSTDRSILEELGHRIACRRRKRDLTQIKLAAYSGLSKRTVERIEAGNSTLLTNLIRVLRVLDLIDNLEDLIPAANSDPKKYRVRKPINAAKKGKAVQKQATDPEQQSPEWCCW